MVSGDGVFEGETASAQFSALADLFTGGTAALLVVPGVGQWQAYLAELTYRGEAGADAVRYSFRFVEAI